MHVYTIKREDNFTAVVSEKQTYIVSHFDPTFNGISDQKLVMADGTEEGINNFITTAKKIKSDIEFKSVSCRRYIFDLSYNFFKLFGYENELAEKYVYGRDKLFPWNYNSFRAEEHKFYARSRIYLIGEEINGLFHYDGIYDTPDDIAYMMCSNKMTDDFNVVLGLIWKSTMGIFGY